MALIANQAKFAYPAPRPQLIAKTITDICGLKVAYVESEHGLDLHEFSGSLSFDLCPNEKVEIRAYKQGAVEKFHRDLNLPELAETIKPSGYYDKDGFQSIYIETQWGHEPTLLTMTQAALQRLGGEFQDGLEIDASALRPVAESEMRERLDANAALHKKRKPIYILGCVFIAATLPFHLVYALVRTPFSLFRLYRKHPTLFKQSNRK